MDPLIITTEMYIYLMDEQISKSYIAFCMSENAQKTHIVCSKCLDNSGTGTFFHGCLFTSIFHPCYAKKYLLIYVRCSLGKLFCFDSNTFEISWRIL